MFVHKRPYTEALVSSCAPNSNYGLSSLPWWTVSPGMLSQNKLSPFKLLLFRYLVTAKIDVCGVVSEGPCRRLFKGLYIPQRVTFPVFCMQYIQKIYIFSLWKWVTQPPALCLAGVMSAVYIIFQRSAELIWVEIVTFFKRWFLH